MLAVVVGYIIVWSHAATPFVTRSGSQLMISGQPFRFSGANLYWVALDDNIRDGAGNPTYPTHYRIDNGFDSLVAMHGTVARTHSIGISVGCSQCLEPAKGQFNNAAFEPIDYAIKSAGQHDIRLMVPLADQWRYYHGGKHTFTNWNGYTDLADQSANAGNNQTQKALEAHFYTDPAVMNDFHTYLSYLLNHVNQYTGVALKDDPTIMAWETGNELFDAPPAWTANLATYLKTTIGVKQLVADGSAAAGMHTANAAVTASAIDILGGHFYDYPSGLDANWAATDAATAAANNKAYIVGEYAWTRSERPAFLAAIEGNPKIAGDMLWAILPHKEDGTPEAHGSTSFGADDVSLHYPTTSATMQTAFLALTQHAQVMNGTTPTPSPTPTPTPIPTSTPLPTPAGAVMVNDAVITGSPRFTYIGSWAVSTGSTKYGSDDHYTAAGNDTATFSFSGTRAQLYGAKAPHHGMAAISVDGGAAVTIDLYAASRSDQALLFDTNALPAGSHTITVRNTGAKNANSTSTVTTLDAAAVITAATPTSTPTNISGDLNNDGKINVFDLSTLLSRWGTADAAADINNDGTVNVFDLSTLLSHWSAA